MLFFEDIEENRFIYTDIHKEFRDHIEALISSNLGELGITSEVFFESCENGRNNRDINKLVFERMIAMEDFETFKKLMTKRNMELQLETIRLYNTARSSRRELLDLADEEQQVADALEASLRSNDGERLQFSVPEDLKGLKSQTRSRDEKLGSINDFEVSVFYYTTPIMVTE